MQTIDDRETRLRIYEYGKHLDDTFFPEAATTFAAISVMYARTPASRLRENNSEIHPRGWLIHSSFTCNSSI